MGGGAASRAAAGGGGAGSARRRSAQRRARAGARRPIGAAPSEEPGGELRGRGRKSGCRPPGPEGWAGGRKLRRGLPPRRFSNFCCRSPSAQTAFRRRRYAPGPRGAGWREGAGAWRGPGVRRSHGAAGRGRRTRFTCRRGGGGRRFTCRSGRRPRRGSGGGAPAAPPGPRTACSHSLGDGDRRGLGEGRSGAGGHGPGVGRGKPPCRGLPATASAAWRPMTVRRWGARAGSPSRIPD